jgi:hypothetical protein
MRFTLNLLTTCITLLTWGCTRIPIASFEASRYRSIVMYITRVLQVPLVEHELVSAQSLRFWCSACCSCRPFSFVLCCLLPFLVKTIFYSSVCQFCLLGVHVIFLLILFIYVYWYNNTISISYDVRVVRQHYGCHYWIINCFLFPSKRGHPPGFCRVRFGKCLVFSVLICGLVFVLFLLRIVLSVQPLLPVPITPLVFSNYI